MIFSEISSNRGYDIVVDGWEMFLSEAQEQMSAMRNGSIRERFIYKLLCCEMDVNTEGRIAHRLRMVPDDNDAGR